MKTFRIQGILLIITKVLWKTFFFVRTQKYNPIDLEVIKNVVLWIKYFHGCWNSIYPINLVYTSKCGVYWIIIYVYVVRQDQIKITSKRNSYVCFVY